MGNYSRDQVKEIISSVAQKIETSQAKPLSHIHDELQSLSDIMDGLHSDILASQSHDVGGKHIPIATDELDAVIGATEEASASIMDACDDIQNTVDSADDVIKNAVLAQTTKIFEACSFQDITGQRISKVVNTLRQIEDSVSTLLGLFGNVDSTSPQVGPEDIRDDDEKLMNGPQMQGQGVSQEEIDKLLAEFD